MTHQHDTIRVRSGMTAAWYWYCANNGLLCRWYDLVLEAEDDIATIMTMEGGKPLKESHGEFQSG